MRSKKILSIGLSLIMILSLAACGGATGASTAGGDAAAEETAEAVAEPAENAGEEASPEAGEQTADGAEQGEATQEAAAGAVDEIPAGDISVKWDDSHIYRETSLGNYATVTTYEVKGYEQVPFLKASAYLDVLLEGKEKISVNGDNMEIAVNGTTAKIDASADTIYVENPGLFRSIGVVSGAVVIPKEYDTVTPSTKNTSTETASKPLTVSLKDYHMPVVAYDGDILMPFLALQNTFGNIAMDNELAYNGKDYFNIIKPIDFAVKNPVAASESPYVKATYSGPFSTMDETTQAYADYGYYANCLLLDLGFGHKEEKNITTFDEYFTRINAKKSMCSTDPAAAMTAEILLFNYLFDSGHDSITGVKTVFGAKEVKQETVEGIADEIKESEEGKELFEEGQKKIEEEPNPEEGQEVVDAILGALLEKGLKAPEIAPLLIWTNYMAYSKPAEYGEQRLDFAGDTAVIYFESFKDDSTERKPSYYLDPIKEEDEAKSSFAFFKSCFDKIKEHDEVKNVVINLSDNGGGAATGLIAILGFLSEDGEVLFTDKDMVTGSYREEWYHVDTNLDGVADDQDGYGGEYEFFIMCNGSSYSCGTALPYFAQQNGVAKVIGTYPGGGDCCVANFVDAYGRSAAFSSFLKLGRETGNGFVSDEKAVTLDYDMMPTIFDVSQVPWFDPEGIADAVHKYQSGETAADYSNGEGDSLSSFFENLFGQMAAAAAAGTAGTAEAAEVAAEAAAE